MKHGSVFERVLLLAAGLLAAYQVVKGVDGLTTLPIISYSVAFGVLLVAGLLLIILGFEVLDSSLVVIVSTVIPLSLSLGLVWMYLATWRIPYLIFVSVGFLAIVVTLLRKPERLATFMLAAVHGVAGLMIFILPVVLSVNGQARPGLALVGVGGALIGVGGLLLSFLKAGKPILSREIILKVLPGLLLLMTAAFVAGFALA
jgi:hypothetical protein